jgi:phytoene desaturase
MDLNLKGCKAPLTPNNRSAMPGTAIVVGGGAGGLSVACRLASKGWRVSLLEKNPRVGGKLNLWEAPHPSRPGDRPFRFDTGPSLLTLPFVFQDLFRAIGKEVRDHLEIRPLDPIASFRWPDGTRFDLRARADDLDAEVARFSPDDLAGWRAFFAQGDRIWRLSAETFLFQSPEQALRGDGTFAPKRALDMLSIPIRIGMFQRYSALVNRHVRHPRLREILYQYATYSGASPFKAPATLAVIPHAETHFGGWYIQGGMYRLAEALETCARELGVDVRTNSPVVKVLVDPRVPVATRDRRRAIVRGVELADGSAVLSDVVILNADLVDAVRRLVPSRFRQTLSDRKLSRLEPGGSGMVLLLGIDGTYPQLSHHTKFMPADYRDDLCAMFETRTVPRDPCIYVCASTRTDPTQAPDGCENLFVLCSAPPLDGKLDWQVEGPSYEQRILHRLERGFGLEDLSRRIVVRRRITPADLQQLYHANAGSIYGIGSNSLKSAFLRPANRDRDIKGLFYVGGATHPGGGLPLVALSGKIVAELVEDE